MGCYVVKVCVFSVLVSWWWCDPVGVVFGVLVVGVEGFVVGGWS